jgi:hypothetical protein
MAFYFGSDRKFIISSFIRLNDLLLHTTVAKEINKLLRQQGEKIKNFQCELLVKQTSY